jgi:hypothetical protein
MTFVKGQLKPNQGKRGPAKATKNAREAIARLVDGNAERMQEWLDRIAEEEGPMAAWRCMADVIEFHVPKLARTEHTGANGGPMQVASVEWTVRKQE